MKLFLLAVLMFVLGSVACARAAIIYISITPQELVDLLGEYGVKGHIEENCVVVVRDGEKSFYFIDDENESIQFYVGYEMDIPLERINEFNDKYRYSKCVKRVHDETAVVSIEIDLNTTGGVTKESLFAFFRIIDLSLEKYHELLFPSASR